MRQLFNGSRGYLVNCSMSQVGHISMFNGSTGSWITWSMGQVGYGLIV